MSLIVFDGEWYELLTKGADNIMEPRVNWKTHEFKMCVRDHLNIFATDGLWTLVMAKKILSGDDFWKLNSEFIALETSNDPNREEKLATLMDKFEENLEFVGVSAIEDKL